MEPSFTRLYARVAEIELAGAAGGGVTLSLRAGAVSAESGPQPLGSELGWECALEPPAGCAQAVLAVHRKRLIGTELVGEATVALAGLGDQQAHAVRLPLLAGTERVGELCTTLMYADYAQLRRELARAEGGGAQPPPPPIAVPAPSPAAASASPSRHAAALAASPSVHRSRPAADGVEGELGLRYPRC